MIKEIKSLSLNLFLVHGLCEPHCCHHIFQIFRCFIEYYMVLYYFKKAAESSLYGFVKSRSFTSGLKLKIK